MQMTTSLNNGNYKEVKEITLATVLHHWLDTIDKSETVTEFME